MMHTVPVYAGPGRSRLLVVSVILAPFLAFAAYIAWLIVPLVLEAVVPEVVRSVISSN